MLAMQSIKNVSEMPQQKFTETCATYQGMDPVERLVVMPSRYGVQGTMHIHAVESAADVTFRDKAQDVANDDPVNQAQNCAR